MPGENAADESDVCVFSVHEIDEKKIIAGVWKTVLPPFLFCGVVTQGRGLKSKRDWAA